MKIYDVIIIGAGPAGLTAAVYSARYGLDVLVIGILPGGLAGEASEICNFPSYGKTKGFELMSKMIKQVKELNVEIKPEKISEIKKLKSFEVITNKAKYFSKKIILATGSERKSLDIEREKELTGRGISYCATCDSGFYKDKIAGVVGGGNAALTAALLLSSFAKKVYIFYRRDKFSKADNAWVKEIEKNEKIEPVFGSVVTKLIGEKNLEAVEINKEKIIKINGLFIEIGSDPQVDLVKQIGVNLEEEEIVVNKKQETNIKGIFAAGDVTNNPLKQIVTACAEGAIAANSAYEELSKEK
ncbi:MAG: NAD(P)/FAD-dependent oxidoreductase [archaeon]